LNNQVDHVLLPGTASDPRNFTLFGQLTETDAAEIGRRVYVTKDNLPRVLNGYGMAVISTSSGIVTNKDAKKQGVGGEVLCEVY